MCWGGSCRSRHSDCFQQDDVEAALFVDASNTFNSLKSAAAMHIFG